MSDRKIEIDGNEQRPSGSGEPSKGARSQHATCEAENDAFRRQYLALENVETLPGYQPKPGLDRN
jgi:hypothetical protein